MKSIYAVVLIFCSALFVATLPGCSGDSEGRKVTDNADAAAIAAYEKEIADKEDRDEDED